MGIYRKRSKRLECPNKENQIKSIYLQKKKEICLRLEEFKYIWNKGSEKDIFAELSFCILTPQSKAKLCCRQLQKY